MIDHRSEIEVSLFDTDERIQALARAAREQACDLLVCVTGDSSPFMRVVDAVGRGCPGAALNMTIDGPLVRIAVLDVAEVDWAAATALIHHPAVVDAVAVVPSTAMWRCIWGSLRARFGGVR